MSLERISESNIHFVPGPIDVHAHPRAFDVLTQDQFIEENGSTEGKAGLREYTEVALKCGITAMIAMPNEMLRLFNPQKPDLTELLPYPIATLDRLRAMQSLISHESVIPTGNHYGLDPAEVFFNEAAVLDLQKIHSNFAAVTRDCLGLKIYGDETTGGNNIDIRHFPTIARVWYETNPEKPITMHLENENVGKVLAVMSQMEIGKQVPVHIAHVSSRQELEAVIGAKSQGMNVTCEVTPHHLFLDESVKDEIGGYGCMKPTLKTRQDIDFIWSHISQVDIFASDCAPHRLSDKEATNPAYGVTNHTLMLPLLFGAVADGKLTLEDIERKLCINPRKRFNIPVEDDSALTYDTHGPMLSAASYEARISPQYGHNPFIRLNRQFHLIGQVREAYAGESFVRGARQELLPSYTHLLSPQTIGNIAIKATIQ